MEYLFVGLGGAAGALCRSLTCTLCDKFWKRDFPLAVFLINVLGCLVIGIFSEIRSISSDLSVTITTGFCGGFTTWSTFASQTLKLGLKRNYLLMIANILSNHIFGGLAVYLGRVITRACLD